MVTENEIKKIHILIKRHCEVTEQINSQIDALGKRLSKATDKKDVELELNKYFNIIAKHLLLKSYPALEKSNKNNFVKCDSYRVNLNLEDPESEIQFKSYREKTETDYTPLNRRHYAKALEFLLPSEFQDVLRNTSLELEKTFSHEEEPEKYTELFDAFDELPETKTRIFLPVTDYSDNINALNNVVLTYFKINLERSTRSHNPNGYYNNAKKSFKLRIEYEENGNSNNTNKIYVDFRDKLNLFDSYEHIIALPYDEGIYSAIWEQIELISGKVEFFEKIKDSVVSNIANGFCDEYRTILLLNKI